MMLNVLRWENHLMLVSLQSKLLRLIDSGRNCNITCHLPSFTDF